MTSKKRPRRPRPAVEDLGEIQVGRDDLDGGPDLAVMLGEDGRAFFAPRSVREATPRQQRAASKLQQWAREIDAARVQLQMAVVDARAEGLSWSTIGWCIGLTGEAARKRFGD